MDEVLPGLWIGDLACALSTEYLSLAGVTHIVSAIKSRLPPPPTLPCGRDIPASNLLHVPVDDEEQEPILVHFPHVNDFLRAILQERWVDGQEGESEELDAPRTPSDKGKWGHWETTGDGTVLVHCQAGCSRSVALVVAYVMATRRYTRDEALSLIRARRFQADPNTGFMDQLAMFERAGYQVDLRHTPIRRWLMSKVDVLNGDSVEDLLMSYYPSPAQSPSPSVNGSHPVSPFAAVTQGSGTGSGTQARVATSLAPPRNSEGQFSSSPSSPTTTPSSSSSASPSSTNPHTPYPPSSPRPDLSVSPAMPSNTDELFRAAAASASDSAHDSPPNPTDPSRWATSITSPHEVLVARSSRGAKLPGGAASIRGHEARSRQTGSGSQAAEHGQETSRNSTSDSGTSAATAAGSSDQHRLAGQTSAHTSLPKPSFQRGTPRLRCKLCRREIAARDHVVEHEPGKGIMAFEVKKRWKDLKGPKTAEEVGSAPASVTPDSSAPAPSPDTLDTIAQRLEKTGLPEGGRESESSHADTASQTAAQPAPSGPAPQLPSEAPAAASAAPASSTAPTQPSPELLRTRSGSPIQSAASLTASLPPHLAALRAGRAPPGAEEAQRRALEQSREKNRLAMERLRARMGVGAPGGSGSASGAAKSPSTAGGSPGSAGTGTEVRAAPLSVSVSAPEAPPTPILHSASCSSYFLEPLDWMYASISGSGPPAEHDSTPTPSSSSTNTAASSSLSSGNLSGKLLCPNAYVPQGRGGSGSGSASGSQMKCSAKLGNWDWAGMQCACGAWVTPAFAVHRSRVDEVWD